MKRSCRFAAILAILVGSINILAQTDPNLENGFKPYGTYSGSNIDSINLENGNLLLHIPMPFGLPQRGKLQPGYFFGITSKQWARNCLGASCDWLPTFLKQSDFVLRVPGVGFENNFDIAVYRNTRSLVNSASPNENQFSDNLTSLTTPDGASHNIAFAYGVTTDVTGFVAYESNADSNGVPQTVSVQDRSGNVYLTGGWHSISSTVDYEEFPDPAHPGQNYSVTKTNTTDVAHVTAVIDSNGNQIVFGGQDTLGRTLTLQGFYNTQNTTDYTGCVSTSSEPVSSATISSYLGFNGAINQVKVCYSNLTLSTNFGVSGVTEYPGGLQEPPLTVAVSIIFLVDGSTWSFQYDSYGNVTYMGLPLGGNIQYQWQTHAFPYCPAGVSNPPPAASRAVTQRTVTDNNGNTYVWKYQYGSVGCNALLTNTMTDPLGNDTVNTFGQLQGSPGGLNDNPLPYYVTTAKNYQGLQTSNTLLKQEDMQYYSNGQSGANNIVNGFVTQIETTINGRVSLTTRTPDANGYGPGTPLMGVVTVEKNYDFGTPNSDQPGALVRETDTSYKWQNNSDYLYANMITLPASIQVKDGNGNTCAETDNDYDDPNRLTTFSGIIPNHVAPPNSVRGNLTSSSRKLASTACSITSSTPSVTGYTNWYDTGEVYQAIDPLTNTTTHTYDLAYKGAYSTKTCNALSQCVSGTYDFSTGVLTSFTNANATTQASGNTPGDSAHTTAYGYDALSRLTTATFPPDPSNNNAHAVTQFAYPIPLTLPLTVTRTKSVTNASTDSSTTTFDGLGRPFKTVHSSAANATVVTQYDGLDHVISVTNPYFSTSDSTYGTIQTQYDALGRVTQTTLQDSGISSSDYSAFPTVTVTDPAGKVRRSRTDALGRLVEVDEPGPGANSSGTHGSGSITVSGSLYSSTSSGTKATGSFTVVGWEQSKTLTQTCYPDPDTGFWVCDPPETVYDYGWVKVTVNGFISIYSYSQNDDAYSVAAGLAAGFNVAGSPVSASVSGATVYLTANQAGPNYSMSQSSATEDTIDFGGPSFSASLSGSSVSGGVYPVTTYDSGSLTVTVGGFQASASYNQNLNNTASAMAGALCDALNASDSTVTATVSGTTITMTANNIGTVSDYSVTGSSTASFTASSTTLGGATNPSGIYAPYVTNYSYDTLGNLTQVNQAGDGSQAARVRTFTYDTLSRLLTAQNPESGTISYSYDDDGNMLHKTSPQANQTGSTTQTISYCYDSLNRVTGKAYSSQTCSGGQLPAGTAAVTYTYDSGTNAIGHLISLTDQVGSASYSYDILGRMSSESRTTAGISESIGYAYYLGSSLKAVTYPSSSVITYTPDSAGRDVSVVDNAAGINYLTGASYGPDNGVTGFTNGNRSGFAGITNSFSYNNRLQPLTVSAASPSATVFSLTYDFHTGAGDNGDVFAIANNKDASRNQTFGYDQLNRLTSAQNAGTTCQSMAANGKTEYWGNSYGYDAWGNLLSKTVTKCSAENLSVNVATNNQLQSGYTYDAAGNMMHDATANVDYAYDAENRISGVAGYTYTYDASGNRVKKSNGSSGTIYWYSAVGVIAESDLSGNMQHEYVFFAGQRIARKDLPGGAVSYYFSDHLKRTSVITDSSGTIKAESDYYPFGGEIQLVNNDTNDYKFAGKKRDSESGLDYFGARYYSNAFGRFVTPDWSDGPATVPYAHLENPQTLNLYSYVDNNPASGIDADGHSPQESMVAGAAYGPIINSALSGTPDASDPLGDEENEAGAEGVQQEHQRILIIVGDPGMKEHNQGKNFQNAADTRAAQLRKDGKEVIEVRASSVEDFNKALTQNGKLNGVEYFGHASWDGVYVGQEAVEGSNIDRSNVGQLSGKNLQPGATITLNACFAGDGGRDSIAYAISKQLGRETHAYDGPTHFAPTHTGRNGKSYPPDRPPVYLLPDRRTHEVVFP